ncbi:MAG: alpha-L-rhamnosidase [Acidobacteria bacterium]|nr:alpha-L-rhamnosidase [Acidobacteriota bacterium]MBW4043963.1 alpha-L-rhamnosidase [Acidobacteriota bacterium]
MPHRSISLLSLFTFTVICCGFAQKQSTIPPGQLDPTRTVRHPQLFSSFHKPLPEQYIWTKDDSLVGRIGAIQYISPGANGSIEPHYFRAAFSLASAPAQATLYVAGPRSAKIYLNGVLAEQISSNTLDPLGMHVFRVNVARLLHAGRNVIAMEVVRGRGIPGSMNSPMGMQQLFGEVMVAKIIPEPGGVDGPAILISGPQWKATLHASQGWEHAKFDDSAWPHATAISPIEGSINLFQWNADAGLYDWPGYEGASPFLAHMYMPAENIENVIAGRSEFYNLHTLTADSTSPQSEFTVKVGSVAPGNSYAPGLTLDFGREVTGRVELISDSDNEATVSIQYGESQGEVNDGPYLGVNLLRIPPHGSAHGPKSAFRYARIRFLSGGSELRFKAIHLEDIYYPVNYAGSFESSDPLLNRIWETGAYTVHLCMQDDIWDAPKRDRGRWMGDTDISGHVSDTIFFDHFLLKDTMSRLVGDVPVQEHVNGIPGYSAFWVTELQNYYRHTGDKQFLEKVHPQLSQLLQVMDKEFDAQNQFTNRTHAWLFVDWAINLYGDNPEVRQATTLEYYRAYVDGANLLKELGDTSNADHFKSRAAQLKKAAQRSLWSQSDGDFGPRWQTNAMAVLSGVADPDQYGSIWTNVLSKVGEPTFRPNLITPYYGAYVLDAMAKMDHRDAALKWIREYWGGMIDEGATTFWEAYDPSWPKDNPHLDLQADGRAGYFVSMAHGWSAAPTYWLMEQVLGIQPVAEGFSRVVIRPDLLDLKWARGQEPTPEGPLKVELHAENGMKASIDVPAGVNATVLFPVAKGSTTIQVNGKPMDGIPAEGGTRLLLTLKSSGHYEIQAE